MDRKAAANGIISSVADRDDTDTVMRPSVAALVLGTYLVIVGLFMLRLILSMANSAPTASSLFSAAAIVVIGGTILASIFYTLLRRNSSHSEREESLRAGMIDYLEACGADVGNLRSADSGIREEERRPRRMGRIVFLLLPPVVCMAAVWFPWFQAYALPLIVATSVLSAVIVLLMAPSMTVFPRKHEDRFITFSERFNAQASALGMSLPGFQRTISYRSMPLFAMLTLITCGVFLVAWVYLMFDDMNRHFDEQRYYEDALVAEVRRRERPA